ncbi:MAG: SAM-dependent methyltransferase [Desulfobacterales bacterium]
MWATGIRQYNIAAVNTIKDADIIFCADWTRDKFPILLQGKEIHDPGFGIFAVYGKTPEEGRKGKRFNYDEKMAQFAEISKIIRQGIQTAKPWPCWTAGIPRFTDRIWYMEAFEDLNPEIVTGVSCFNAANAALKKGVTSGIKAHSVILTASFGREDYKGPDSIENLAKNQPPWRFSPCLWIWKKSWASLNPLSRRYAGGHCSACRILDKGTVIIATLDTTSGRLRA